MTAKTYDLAVVGGGIMGGTVALYAARAGLDTVLFERDSLARGASGVNAGTLTLQMTRAALIPYAIRAQSMWASAGDWLGHDVGVTICDGLSVAFTEQEEALLVERAEKRRDAGAPINVITAGEACRIEPGLSERIRMASHCAMDGFANAYQTGAAYRAALTAASVDLKEYCNVHDASCSSHGFRITTSAGHVHARQIVLAGGVWLEPMLRWFGLNLPIKTLVNQLAVTERAPPVMRTVLGIASGLLSLKQFPHGSVVIGGGWQGQGSREANSHQVDPASLQGNVRLASYTIPALVQTNVVRAWTGFEAETADAMPAVGQVPGVDGAWVCGSVHSGYTSGPYIARCLVQALLGEEPEMPLFPIDRLLITSSSAVTSSLPTATSMG
ncbi:MAG: NAD(P)/FAD-dependent oxidoreductase [Granulosicoccus sp.]